MMNSAEHKLAAQRVPISRASTSSRTITEMVLRCGLSCSTSAITNPLSCETSLSTEPSHSIITTTIPKLVSGFWVLRRE